MAESIDLLTAYVRIKQEGLKEVLRSLDSIKKKAEEIRNLKLDEALVSKTGRRPAIYKSDFVGADSLEKSAAQEFAKQQRDRVAAQTASAKRIQEIFASERQALARRQSEQKRNGELELANARRKGGELAKLTENGVKESAKKAAEFDAKINEAIIRARGGLPAVFKSKMVGLDTLEKSGAQEAVKQQREKTAALKESAKKVDEIFAHERGALAKRLADQKRNDSVELANARRKGGELSKLTAAGIQESAKKAAEFDAKINEAIIRARGGKPAVFKSKFIGLEQVEGEGQKEANRQKEANAAAYRDQLNFLKAQKKQRDELKRELNSRLQTRSQAFNSLSLELGFLGGRGTQQLGNLFRIAGLGRRIAESYGLVGAKATAAGIALSGFAGVAKIVFTAMEIVTNAVNRLVRALSTLAVGAVKALFGPTLTLIGLMKRLAQNLTLVSLAAAALATRELVNVGRQFERIRNQFSFVFGANARTEMQKVTQDADRLGLPLANTAEQYARISVAARGANIAQATVKQLFQGIGRASVTLGLDAERVNGIFFAFEQIISKGKVSAEELRRQLGDRLPGAFSLAARALGKTTAELDKLLETGQLGSKEFVEAVSRQLNREFFISSLVQSKSLAASLIRLDNAFVRLKATIASGAVIAFTGLINVFTKFINKIAEGRTVQVWIKLISDALHSLAGNFSAALRVARSFLVGLYLPLREIFKIMVMVNSVAIAGLLEGLRRSTAILRQFAGFLEKTVFGLTGVKIEGLEDAFSFSLAVAENISAVIDVMVLRLKEVPERFRMFFDSLVGNGFFKTLYMTMQSLGAALAAGFIRKVAEILQGSGFAKALGLLDEARQAAKLASLFDVTGAGFAKSGQLFAEALDDAFTNATSRASEIADAMERVGKGIESSFNRAKLRSYLQELKTNLSDLIFRRGLGGLASLFGARPAGASEDPLKAGGKNSSNDYVDIARLRDELESSVSYDIAASTDRTAAATAAMQAILSGMATEAKNFYAFFPEAIKAAASAATSSLPGGGIR